MIGTGSDRDIGDAVSWRGASRTNLSQLYNLVASRFCLNKKPEVTQNTGGDEIVRGSSAVRFRRQRRQPEPLALRTSQVLRFKSRVQFEEGLLDSEQVRASLRVLVSGVQRRANDENLLSDCSCSYCG